MTSSTISRVLIVGTGSIGRRHINNISALRPGVKWAFLRDEVRHDTLSKSLNANVFADAAEAIKWQPHLAVIATPSFRHGEILLNLLRAVIPCYIEKPIVTQLEHLQALSQINCSSLPATQVGCNLRFLPSLKRLHSIVHSGELGRIVRADFEVGQWLPDWRPQQDYRKSYSASRAHGGGVIFDLIHEIDLACWLFGPATLFGAWGGHLSSLEINSEDTALLALKGAQGELLSVRLDYVSRTLVRRVNIVGDKASLEWDLPRRRLFMKKPGGTEVNYEEGFDMGATYVEAMRELILAIETGSATSLPLMEGLAANHIAIAANQQIRQYT